MLRQHRDDACRYWGTVFGSDVTPSASNSGSPMGCEYMAERLSLLWQSRWLYVPAKWAIFLQFRFKVRVLVCISPKCVKYHPSAFTLTVTCVGSSRPQTALAAQPSLQAPEARVIDVVPLSQLRLRPSRLLFPQH